MTKNVFHDYPMPCPFCAGIATTHKIFPRYGELWVIWHEKESWCPLNNMMPAKYTTEEDLLKAWNTRR